MKLYHGSNVGVRTPELRPLVRALDFGRAFYLTTDPEQAMKWAHTTTKRRGEGAPIVTCFEMQERDLADLAVLRFEGPTSDWLKFVSRNRNEGLDDSGMDIVIGPVANDNTMPVLNLYFKGAYTEEEALKRLLTQRLRDQYAFKTQKAIAMLTYIGEAVA